MIKILAPQTPANAISTFDIETDSDGKLLDIGFQHANEYETFTSWLGFIQYLVNYSGEELITTCWAHNGGRFDTVALVCELYHNDSTYKKIIVNYSASLINGSILELDLELADKIHIKFRDSFRLFPMPLKKVLKSLNLSNKHDVPDDYITRMQDYKKEYPAEYYAYLKQDCFGLYSALKTFRDTVNDISPIGELPVSLGSLALKIFRTSFLNEEIVTPPHWAQKFADNSYSGGRTEYFGNGIKNKSGVYENCNYYDYNSMYPAEMLNGYFPFGSPAHSKELVYLESGELMPGCYEIDFEQTGGHIPLLRGWVKDRKTKEHVWQGSGVYTSDELLYLKNIGAKIKVKAGIVYPQSKKLFKEFVQTLYDKRMTARASNDAAMDLICKLTLNNLYGKFGQREESEELKFLPMEEIIQIQTDIASGKERKILSIALMDFDNQEIQCNDFNVFACAVKSTRLVEHRHVLIAAMITARCRCKITALAERYHKTAIYCDTDSFITQTQIDRALICPNTLGMLKPEHENISMIFYGRKQYYIIGGELKQKGVKIKAEEIEKFNREVKTETGYVAPYRAPSGIKQAIKKGLENPNYFDNYQRTIKTDLSSAEKGLLK